MLNTLFQGVFTSTTTIQIPQFLLCIAVSLAIGLFLSFLYMHKSHYTKSFVVTLALLPAVVCVPFREVQKKSEPFFLRWQPD